MAQPNPAMINPGPADPLAQLRDIHLPGPIEAWPPAPGWIGLAVLAALVVIAIAVYFFKRWQKNQYRRDAIKELQSLHEAFAQNADQQAYLENCARLLKRIALTRYPRNRVASLTGEAWVQFLDQTAATDEFSMGAGQALIEGCYEPQPQVLVEDLHKAASYWIKQHRDLEQAA